MCQRFSFLLGIVLLLGLTGCRGWARVQGGGAYNLPNRDGHSGNYVAVDGVISPKNFKFFDDKPLPVAFHTSADGIIAPERKSIGWGTGLAYYREPRPVSWYIIGGTSAHFDQIGDRLSFGNVSPYGELGILASVPARYDDGGDGLILTLGLAGATYFNYLAGKDNVVDGFMLVKLGVGWEKN